MVRVLILAALAIAAIVPTPGVAGGKPFSAPVDIVFSPPPADAKRGDVIDTDIQFRARADLQRLEVTIRPFFGLQILSDTTHVVATDVKRGDGPLVKVKVRLTEASGSLAVLVETVTASTNETDAGAITIEYGK